MSFGRTRLKLANMKIVLVLLLGLAAVQAFPSLDPPKTHQKAWKKASASQFEQAARSENSSSDVKKEGDEIVQTDVQEEDASNKSAKASKQSSGSVKTIQTDHGKETESVEESSESFESKSSETKKKVTKTTKRKAKPDNDDDCESGDDDIDDTKWKHKRGSSFDDRNDSSSSDDDSSSQKSGQGSGYPGGDGPAKKHWNPPSSAGTQKQIDTPDGKSQSQTIHSLNIPGQKNNFHGTLTQTQSMGKNGRGQSQGAATKEEYTKSADGKTASFTRLDQEGKSDKYGQTQKQMLRNEEKTKNAHGYEDTKNMLAQTQTQTDHGQSESQSAMTETSSYSETEC